MKVRYLRLVTYGDAVKTMNHINLNEGNDYANITTGGLRMDISNENWEGVRNFIESLDVVHEIGEIHPRIVSEGIINELKLRNNNL
jgi:hypothetical protein